MTTITIIEPQTKPDDLFIKNTNQSCSYVNLYKLLPKNHDIRSIQLETVPENLQKVCLFIGGQPVATMCDLSANSNILEEFMYDICEKIPISKSNYMETWLVFYFSKNLTNIDPTTYSEHHHTIKKYDNCDDDYDSHDEENFYGDNMVTVYDEDEDRYVTGRVVVSKLTTVMLLYFHTPRIVVETVENKELSAFASVKIWQKIKFDKKQYTEDIMKKYACRYEFFNMSGDELLEKYRALGENDESFETKIVNILRFTNGMAGLSYRF